jgi:hypothetical protein
MEDRKIKKRLVASLMFLLLGSAPGLFAHGDDEAISYSETKVAEKRHTEEARKGLMRDRKEKLDSVNKERTDKMMAEQARIDEAKKQDFAKNIAKIKEERRLEMTQNKGSSLQEMAAAFMVKSHQEKGFLESEKKKLTREEKKELGFEFRHILSKYNLEHDAEKELTEEGFLMVEEKPGLYDVVYKAMFEKIVSRASKKLLEDKVKVLRFLTREEGFRKGFRSGTRLLVEKIDLCGISWFEMSEEELVKVINNAFAHENLTSFNFARNNLGRMAELRKAMWAGVKKSKNLTKLYLYKNNLESNQTKELELLGFTKGKGDEWSRDPDEEEGLINIVKNLFGW